MKTLIVGAVIVIIYSISICTYEIERTIQDQTTLELIEAS